MPKSSNLLAERGIEVRLGDSLAHRAVDRESADLVFADPPYLLSGNGARGCKAGRWADIDKGAWDQFLGFDDALQFHRRWLANTAMMLKPSGALWCTTTRHSLGAILFTLQGTGWRVINCGTWCKPNAPPQLSCRALTHSTEQLIWAAPPHAGRARYRFNDREMRERFGGGKQVRDWWVLPAETGNKKVHTGHPTQKPVALLERILACSTLAGDLVVDPFVGSGTTGVAAARRGCRFVGVDNDRRYVRMATARIAAELA